MGGDYRDGRRSHPRDPRSLTDRPRLSAGTLLDRLVRKARDAGVRETLGDRSRLERTQVLEPLAFTSNVALVTHAAFEDAALLAIESRECERLDGFESLYC
jgi:hypothetical protein